MGYKVFTRIPGLGKPQSAAELAREYRLPKADYERIESFSTEVSKKFAAKIAVKRRRPREASGTVDVIGGPANKIWTYHGKALRARAAVKLRKRRSKRSATRRYAVR